MNSLLLKYGIAAKVNHRYKKDIGLLSPGHPDFHYTFCRIGHALSQIPSHSIAKKIPPNAKQFISQYRLGTPSNVKRSLDALMTKEMIYQEPEEKGSFYQVYDCFLARWLERM